jgi:GNAT superfamily N-acetyltransferase
MGSDPSLPAPVMIRSFRQADLPRVVALVQRDLREINARDYPPDVIEHMCEEYSIDGFQSKISEFSALFVAEIHPARGMGRHIVGIGGWTPHPTEPGTAYLRGMFVDPDWHGHGIGTRILDAIAASARSAGKVVMEGNASLTAVGFYERLGFSAGGQKDMGVVGVIVPVKRLLDTSGNSDGFPL